MQISYLKLAILSLFILAATAAAKNNANGFQIDSYNKTTEITTISCHGTDPVVHDYYWYLIFRDASGNQLGNFGYYHIAIGHNFIPKRSGANRGDIIYVEDSLDQDEKLAVARITLYQNVNGGKEIIADRSFGATV